MRVGKSIFGRNSLLRIRIENCLKGEEIWSRSHETLLAGEKSGVTETLHDFARPFLEFYSGRFHACRLVLKNQSSSYL